MKNKSLNEAASLMGKKAAKVNKKLGNIDKWQKAGANARRKKGKKNG